MMIMKQTKLGSFWVYPTVQVELTRFHNPPSF